MLLTTSYLHRHTHTLSLALIKNHLWQTTMTTLPVFTSSFLCFSFSSFLSFFFLSFVCSLLPTQQHAHTWSFHAPLVTLSDVSSSQEMPSCHHRLHHSHCFTRWLTRWTEAQGVTCITLRAMEKTASRTVGGCCSAKANCAGFFVLLITSLSLHKTF